MQPYQRTNHLPGIYNLAKKNMLGRHLMRLQSVFPDDYNFYPVGWTLPLEAKDMKRKFSSKKTCATITIFTIHDNVMYIRCVRSLNAWTGTQPTP